MGKNNEQFVLGSGKLYIAAVTDVDTIPDDAVLEVEANRVGKISGGATVEYKPSYIPVSDDLGEVKKSILSAEEITFKSGVLIKNMSFLGFAAPTSRVASDSKGKTTKIGGLANASGKSYFVRFVHVSTVDPGYTLRVTMVGTMTEGFSLAFAKDKETITDLTFSAEPLDSDGTLILIAEPADTEPAPPPEGE